MSPDIFRELQKRLDLYSVGFPATPSGIEIRVLKKLFSEEDAAIFLSMTHLLEAPEAVAGKLGLPVPETREKLADMARRGLLFSKVKGDTTCYGATPFVHGVFEYQVNRMDEEFAELMEEYEAEAFNHSLAQNASSVNRVVPVQKSLEVKHRAASYDDAVEILRSKDKIVVAECICRKAQNVRDKGCGKELEACFMFGSMGDYYLEHGLGREASIDEAITILEKARKQGLVTQPATSRNPAGMCNCCGDCCEFLKAVNSHPKPAQIVGSNHYAVLDRSLCKGCKVCIDRCQTNALIMDADKLAVLNPDRCIGCGLCVTTCPSGALCLVPKPKKEQYKLPSDSMAQMTSLAIKRMAFNPILLIGNIQIQARIIVRMARRLVSNLF
jgi:ferredoxin